MSVSDDLLSRNAIAIGDFFVPAFQSPHRVQCVGINGESSFESTLLKRAPGCEAWGYDYSVNSWGPEITGDPEVRDRAHFKPFALGGTNNHEDHDNPKYWTLDSFMDLKGNITHERGQLKAKKGSKEKKFAEILSKENGILALAKFIRDTGRSKSTKSPQFLKPRSPKSRTAVKAEFDALTAFLNTHAAAEGDVLSVGELQLEIHAREGHENFEYFARWWAAGLRPFWTEPNLVYINLVRGVRPELAEYPFINIRGNHALVNEAFK
ncbi:hypothetical protein EDB92DRAFT_2104791 [Lactarius akahatsu]|uniref:Uncharacterized protein n=1 Tax=Lactarius akahatsu TaxID=416441 RepID=A0AAD4LEF1_9AGAM|nr:hypothetical protein EDB92DRAFT_2104791 [Lactarius akahatsu]